MQVIDQLGLPPDGLARYCEEVPAESRRFIKDQAVLAEISRTAAERVETIRSLISALEELK